MTVVLPFRTAPSGTVEWIVHQVRSVADGPMDEGQARWTLGADLLIDVDFKVERGPLLKHCGLKHTDAVELAIFAESAGRTGTRVKHPLTVLPIPRGGGVSARDVRVPGSLVSGTLSITATVRLAAEAVVTPPSPTRRGSILWRESRSLALEEDTDLLRVIPVEEPSRRHSLWAAKVDLSDLTRPFVDAARITVNTLNPLAAKLIDAENNPNRGLTAQFFNALQQLMMADIRRQLVEIALTSDALAEHPHDPEDSTSVAGVLLNQLALIFNGDDITSIRMRFMRDPVEITQWVHDATLRRFF